MNIKKLSYMFVHVALYNKINYSQSQQVYIYVATLYHTILCLCFSQDSLEISTKKMITMIEYMQLTEISYCIPVNLWELLGGGDLPPTNSSKGEILCVAFKPTKLYLVVAYM